MKSLWNIFSQKFYNFHTVFTKSGTHWPPACRRIWNLGELFFYKNFKKADTPQSSVPATLYIFFAIFAPLLFARASNSALCTSLYSLNPRIRASASASVRLIFLLRAVVTKSYHLRSLSSRLCLVTLSTRGLPPSFLHLYYTLFAFVCQAFLFTF